MIMKKETGKRLFRLRKYDKGVKDMFYDSELHFLQSIYSKCRLQLLVLEGGLTAGQEFDLGLRRMLGVKTGQQQIVEQVLKVVRPNTVYRLTDQYSHSPDLRTSRLFTTVLIIPLTEVLSLITI